MELIMTATQHKKKKSKEYVRGQTQTDAVKRAKHVYYMKNKESIALQAKHTYQKNKKSLKDTD